MLSIGSTLQQISRTFHVKFFAHWLAIPCLSLPAAPGNHDSILCFSEFDYRIYLIYVYSYSIYPYEIGLFYIISSRFIHNLFSEGLRVQLFQSFLEVSIIAGMGLLFVSFGFFFPTSAWLITAICSMKIQRATVTVVPGILWAIYKIPSALISQHGSGQHLPGDWRRQSRLWSEFPSLILLVMIAYTAVVQRVGFIVQLAPSCLCQCALPVLYHIPGTQGFCLVLVCARTHTLL